MSMKNYLILCVLVSVAVVLSLLFWPGLAETVEQYMLFFLSTNAR
ncbi:MAG: hypothetical protein RIC89_12445 [Pseudomonadales bacterium]